MAIKRTSTWAAKCCAVITSCISQQNHGNLTFMQMPPTFNWKILLWLNPRNQKKVYTIKQEQKPGRLSDWESAVSAGLRTVWSPLRELASNWYIIGRSEADNAIEIFFYKSSFYNLFLSLTTSESTARWNLMRCKFM